MHSFISYLARAQVAGKWAVIGRGNIACSADVIVTVHCALQLQQAHHDKGEFHQVPQRETEGLSAQRGAVSTSATGPDQGSDWQIWTLHL